MGIKENVKSFFNLTKTAAKAFTGATAAGVAATAAAMPAATLAAGAVAGITTGIVGAPVAGLIGITYASKRVLDRIKKRKVEQYASLGADNIAEILSRYEKHLDLGMENLGSPDINKLYEDFNNNRFKDINDDENLQEMIYKAVNNDASAEEHIKSLNATLVGESEELKAKIQETINAIETAKANKEPSSNIILLAERLTSLKTEALKAIEQQKDESINNVKAYITSNETKLGGSIHAKKIQKSLITKIEASSDEMKTKFENEMNQSINKMHEEANDRIHRLSRYGRLAQNHEMYEILLQASKLDPTQEAGSIAITPDGFEFRDLDIKDQPALQTITGRKFTWNAENSSFNYSHPPKLNFFYHLDRNKEVRMADYKSLALAARVKFKSLNIDVSQFEKQKDQDKCAREFVRAAVESGFPLKDIQINGKPLSDIQDKLFEKHPHELQSITSLERKVQARETKFIEDYKKDYAARTRPEATEVTSTTPTLGSGSS